MIYTINYEFKVNRWANLYFFIYNLSECHFSCRKQYNKIWLEKTGALTKWELSALLEFKKIRVRYRDTKSIFEKAFFFSRVPYKELAKVLKNEELGSIKTIFDTLEAKFKIIYKEDLSLLKKWEKKLTPYVNDKNRNKEIIKKLEIFYNAPLEKDYSVNCFLLISPATNGGGGGANIDNESVTCEMSHNTPDNLDRITGTVWHETTHLIFENKYLMPLLKDYFKDDMEKIFTLRELINSSLFPQGVLREMIFHQKSGNTLHNRFATTEKQTSMIKKLSREYLEKGKVINKEYINTAAEYLNLR